ncbi:MAG: NAD+ synthase [bacterium]|nr:NAD+ synthase [bacterium]
MELNEKEFADKACNFLKDYMAKNNIEKVVIGLSGGIDSAVALALAERAIGADRIIAVMMPNGEAGGKSRDHAVTVAKKFEVKDLREVDISPAVNAFKEILKTDNGKCIGNIAARSRMITLYDTAAREKAIVLGTENKTEHYFAYFTKAGDEVSDIELIRDLYKTQVRQLARFLGVPKEIIEKPPTADLWEGQTDEDELGITYETADRIIKGLVEDGKSERELIGQGLKKRDIETVKKRMADIAFKLQEVPCPVNT